MKHMAAILAGVEDAVRKVHRDTGALALVTLHADRTPEGAPTPGYRITLIVDMPDAFVEDVAASTEKI